MRHGLYLIFLAASVAACGANDPLASDADYQEAMRDPLLRAAMRDPEFRNAAARDPTFWKSMRDPEVRNRVRVELLAENYPLPSKAVMDAAEQRLASHPCVGSLSSWSRTYSLWPDHKRGLIDEGRLRFALREAGAFEFKSGRRAVNPFEDANIDDRAYRVAFGFYDVAKDAITMENCGPNMPG